EEFAERIWKGDIAIDLYRPVNFQGWWLASDLGRAAFQFLGRGVGPTLAGALAFHLTLPADVLRWTAFLAAILLSIIVSFAIRYLVALSGFWLMDSNGVTQLSTVVALFLSGMMLPLTLFPHWLGTVAQL